MLKNLISIFTLILLIALTAQISFGQDEEVANYSIGKYNGKNYEHFSFWVSSGKRSRITYSYRNQDKNIELTYLGVADINGQKGFKVQFPNKLILFVTPNGDVLKVTDENGKYTKYFRWEYEGPVNGIGTACGMCVGEDKEAIKFIKKYFL